MVSGVEPYANAEAGIGLVALVLDLRLGVREEALDRDRWTFSLTLSRDRLRVEDELPVDDKGETGRSISLRRLSLATLNANTEPRGFASCPWSGFLAWADLGEGSGEGGRDFDLVEAGRELSSEG